MHSDQFREGGRWTAHRCRDVAPEALQVRFPVCSADRATKAHFGTRARRKHGAESQRISLCRLHAGAVEGIGTAFKIGPGQTATKSKKRVPIIVLPGPWLQ